MKARKKLAKLPGIRRVANALHSLRRCYYERKHGIANAPVDPEQLWYQRIIELAPELASYKVQTIDHLQARAEELELASLEEYHQRLLDDAEELEWLRSNFTFKGTHFFRGDDWGVFGSKCLSTFAGADSVRVWCAGCSYGAEVYSTVMMLLDYVPSERIDVLATDYNEELLERTRNATYIAKHAPEIPDEYQRYVQWLPNGKHYTFGPEVTGPVHTANLNLLTEGYPAPFDIIVCRNVIKFFAPDVRRKTQEQLAASLAPGGFLFLSDDDNSNGIELIERPGALGLRQVAGRSIYQRIS